MVVNEGAGEVFEYDGRRLYGVCVAEKGVFRFTLTAEGRAGHASIPRIGDNALVKLAPAPRGARASGRVVPEHSPEPDAFLDALGVDRDDLAAALEEVEAARPDDRRAAGADARRDAGADDGQRLGEDQRDPLAARAEGGLPGAARAWARTTR